MQKRFLPAFLALVLSLGGCAGRAFAQGRPPAVTAAQAAGRAAAQDDAVRRAILPGPTPPRTIFEVRERLLARGGRLATHVVANRGHENPEAGSFSFFEAYTGPMEGGTVADGELFIGFFSEREGDVLQVQQGFEPGLMAELIAWDYTKRMYNFWELVGTGQGSEWKYRGDSADVLADVKQVNAGGAAAAFGQRLRCSGCHGLGGPIMKELPAPHNDWWTDAHKLELGSMKLASTTDPDEKKRVAARLFAGAQDASGLARRVKAGTERLLAERARRGDDGQSLRLALRSLFVPMELNLASDVRPYAEQAPSVALPAGFFVDARLAGEAAPVAVPRAAYARALADAGSRFAPDEADRPETRHAFVVPQRSMVDDAQLDALVRRGAIDEETIADVLAVDFTTPLWSPARAALLRHVPERAAGAADLRAKLVASLKTDASPAAQALLRNLTDPALTAAAHRKRAQAFLTRCRARQAGALPGWMALASQRRAEVAAAQTSQNPRGTILEPGFRVIFPQDRLASKPGALQLREADCGCD